MKKRNVLLVGSGGREHALAWKLLKSPILDRLYIAPGNGGTTTFNVPIAATDVKALCEFAEKNQCYSVIGPEAPLALGLVDELKLRGLEAFGPTKQQAMLETSKVYAKRFMVESGIPTAAYNAFSESSAAFEYAQSKGGQVVIKADGLAAGKGVFVCSSFGEAEAAIKSILVDRIFGSAGAQVVIEDRLAGSEVSVMSVCDGKNAYLVGTAVDHKRLFEGNEGPNTGGMGAYSPPTNFPPELEEEVMKRIVRPTVRNTGFIGFLYAGLMLTSEGPRVLEFNARMGDPETQVIMPRLNSDLLDALICSSSGERVEELAFSGLHSCCVVMCAEGYPATAHTGDEIHGVDDVGNDVLVFHAGTKIEGGRLLTNGGRVLCVTSLGSTLMEASERAYSAVEKISWKGEYHRRDIATQTSETETKGT